MTESRGLASFVAIMRSVLGYRVAGPVDHLALYPGRVVSQSADKTRVDVQLDSDRMASPSNIPLRLGIPGTTVTLNLSQTVRVLVGWEGGDPSKPYAMTWDPAAGVTAITIAGTTVYLGSDTGANFVALANLVDAELNAVALALGAHTHAGVTVGGGTSGAPAAPPYTPQPVAATQVKAK